jgi:hypothetical protein
MIGPEKYYVIYPDLLIDLYNKLFCANPADWRHQVQLIDSLNATFTNAL